MSERISYCKFSNIAEVPCEKAKRHRGVLKFITVTAAAAIAVISGNGKARAEPTPFDDAVNAISAPGTNDPSGAQIIPGLHPHRFKLTFSGVEPIGFRNTIYAGEFNLRDSQDGNGIEIRRLGSVVAVPNTENAGTYFELDRGDGCTVPIWANHFEIHDGAETKWTTGASCEATVSAVHIGPTSRELKIIGGPFNVPAWNGIGRGNYDAWLTLRISADFCSAIQRAINAASTDGLTPEQIGLIDAEESTTNDELTAPSAGSLAAVTRAMPEGAQLNFLYVRDSSGKLLHLQRNANATWTIETAQNGRPENSVGNIIWSMSKQKTSAGREVFILISGITRHGTSEPMLAALAFKNIAPNVFSEVRIIMSQSSDEPDDDGDGRINSNDGCIGRANPVVGIDIAGPSGPDEPDGKEDECQANCGDAWPIVSSPAGFTETDFWECASELGFPHALTRGDGSTLHYTGNLERDVDGAFLLQSGQRVRWIHAPAAQYQGPMLKNPTMKIKQGNSARFRILSAKYPNGRDGSLTFSHYEYGSNQPTVRFFSEPTDWQESGGIGFGDALESETGEFEIEVRNENFMPAINSKGCGCGSNKTPNILSFTLGIAVAFRSRIRKIFKN